MEKALSILFYSKGGAFRSQAGLYRESKRLKLPYTQKQVTEFVKNQLQKELFTPHRNTNSYTPDANNSQWHTDIAETAAGLFLVCVDTFSKRMHWEPISKKDEPSLKKAFMSTFEVMGKPQSLYSDQEKALQSAEFKKFLDSHNVRLVVTHSGHAAIAERAIRTVKERLALVRFDGNRGHTDNLISEIVKDYNQHNINRVTGTTPNEAAKESNHDEIRAKLVENSSDNSKPLDDLEKGDSVRVAVKLQANNKKHVARWSSDIYEINDIDYVPGAGSIYKITIINEGGKKVKEEFTRKDIIPAVASGEELERAPEPIKEKEKVTERAPTSKVLATVRNDPDSTFKPVEGKRIKINKNEK